ncbi:MAG: serine hydrolase [Acidimicrobiia bacterium]|nr:serine hydrolase [Acidimicrobiia bacterium]
MPRRGVALVALLALLVAAVAALAPSPAGAGARAAVRPSQSVPPPKAWVLADADTGTVLAASNEHEALPPASLVKVMTALTVLDAVSLDSTVTVSELAAAQPAMRIGMEAGDEWPLVDALASLLMVSANDAAYALAEAASGDLEGFAEDMDALGERLGLRDSTFADPAGLDDTQSFGGGSRMSAWDLAVVARNALVVPEISFTAALVEHELVGPDGVPHTLRNHNSLLQQYEGANGLKTGYTEKAGRCLLATAHRDGRTLVAVVLGYYDYNGFASWLFDQGFARPRDDPGTGDRLPEPAMLTVDARQRAVDALPRILGRPVLATRGPGEPATAAAEPRAEAATSPGSPGAVGDAPAAEEGEPVSSGGRGRRARVRSRSASSSWFSSSRSSWRAGGLSSGVAASASGPSEPSPRPAGGGRST